MTPFRACRIIDGSYQWEEPLEYLEACLYAATHQASVQGLLGPAYLTIAKHIADYAVDFGETAACQLIRETREEAKAKLPSADLDAIADKGWKDNDT